MTERWDIELTEPLAFRGEGAAGTLRTLEDARGLLSAQEEDGADRATDVEAGKLRQSAATALGKAAASGQPADRTMATEQMRILLRSLGWL